MAIITVTKGTVSLQMGRDYQERRITRGYMVPSNADDLIKDFVETAKKAGYTAITIILSNGDSRTFDFPPKKDDHPPRKPPSAGGGGGGSYSGIPITVSSN